MSKKRHIVCLSNKNTKEDKNDQLPKRSPNQTNQRTTRPNSVAVPGFSTNAWLSNNNQNSQIIRRLLRTKHRLSSPSDTRKERPRDKPVEHKL